MARKRPVNNDLPSGLWPKQLRNTCEPNALGFTDTRSLKPLRGFIGPERAIDAIKLAAGIAHKEFNLYVLGPEGTGRHKAVTQMLAEAVPSLAIGSMSTTLAHHINPAR